MNEINNKNKNFSIDDLRKAFEGAKIGEWVKKPVLIDQYGSYNMEDCFVSKYQTFEEWFNQYCPLNMTKLK